MSVWVGTFDSIDAAEEYFGIPDEIGVYLPPEQFVAEFGLGEFEPEKLAAYFERLTPRPVAELLATAPGTRQFSDEVVQTARNIGVGDQQGIALLYDYSYQPAAPPEPNRTRLHFLGTFRYRPSIRPEHSNEFRAPPLRVRLRTWLSRAVALILVVSMLAACSGFLPPWRVLLTLAGGLLAGAVGVACERPAWGATAFGCAVLLSFVLLRDVVEVRPSTPEDAVRPHYFGFYTGENES